MVAISLAGCGGGSTATHVTPRSSAPVSAVDGTVRDASNSYRHSPVRRVPSSRSFSSDTAEAASSPDDPENVLLSALDDYRQWTCRMIDFEIAVSDGDVSGQEAAAAAANEIASRVPRVRRAQGQAAAEELLEGDPSALRALACL